MPIPFPSILFGADPVPPVSGMYAWFDFADPAATKLVDGTVPTKDTPATAEIYGIYDKALEKTQGITRPNLLHGSYQPRNTRGGWHFIAPKNAAALNGRSVLHTEGRTVITGGWENLDEVTLFIVFKLVSSGVARCPVFGQQVYTAGESTYSPLVSGPNANLWTLTPSGAVVSNRPFVPDNTWKILRHEKFGLGRVTNWIGNMSGGDALLSADPLTSTGVGYTLGGALRSPYFDTAYNTLSGYYAEIIAYSRALTQAQTDSTNRYLMNKWGNGNTSFGN